MQRFSAPTTPRYWSQEVSHVYFMYSCFIYDSLEVDMQEDFKHTEEIGVNNAEMRKPVCLSITQDVTCICIENENMFIFVKCAKKQFGTTSPGSWYIRGLTQTNRKLTVFFSKWCQQLLHSMPWNPLPSHEELCQVPWSHVSSWSEHLKFPSFLAKYLPKKQKKVGTLGHKFKFQMWFAVARESIWHSSYSGVFLYFCTNMTQRVTRFPHYS